MNADLDLEHQSERRAYWRGRAERAEAALAAKDEALRDEIAMAEQTQKTLRDLHANWRTIIEKQDPDGGPLIENILYWLIEDLDSSQARAALAAPATDRTNNR